MRSRASPSLARTETSLLSPEAASPQLLVADRQPLYASLAQSLLRDISQKRYPTGSMIAATEEAFRSNTHTVSPTSGFHHAFEDRASGYCTFNGLVIAANRVRKLGAQSVGILDLDAHYGNGTDALIKGRDMSYVKHWTQGKHFHGQSDTGRNAEHYFWWLRKAIDSVADCDVVLCQFGADPHINDPLGGEIRVEQIKQ